MYSIDLEAIIQASKIFPIVPNHVLVSGQCTCCQPDCKYPGKHPALSNGFLGASQDVETIGKWHKATAGILNIGARMGAGLVAFDTDPRNGGDESFRRLEKRFGQFPRTPKAISGGGGFHLFFADPWGLGKFNLEGFPGIDVQGEGSQVVLPPSLHASGNFYRWELAPIGIEAGVEQVPFAPLPDWFFELVPEGKAKFPPKAGHGHGLGLGLGLGAAARGRDPMPVAEPHANGPAFTFVLPPEPEDFATAGGVADGEGRHRRLLELAGRHFSNGEGYQAVFLKAQAWNLKNLPPLEEKEVERQVKALAKKERAKKEQQPPFPESEGIEPEPEVEGGRWKPEPEREPEVSTFHFPPPGEAEPPQGERIVVQPSLSLHPDAFHGLLGSIAKAIEPETEADAAGVLVSLLVAFGSAVGPKPHTEAGADRHGANTFALLVGGTSCRKGQAESVVSWLMEQADAQWAKDCVAYGLGTGEGLAERLQDELITSDKKGNISKQPGATDKRLLAIEREFASVLKKGRREGNCLSDVVRNAWDGKPLEVVNRRKNSLKATGHHVSILGHITPEELGENLKGSEVSNGFLNRFLLTASRRSKRLPSGGNISVLTPFITTLKEAIAKAASLGLVKRTQDAEKAWAEWYCALPEREGIVGKVTARAEAHALRLSLIYALADGSSFIDVQHLRAGLAVWDYCERGAVEMFSGKGEGTTLSLPLSLPEKLLQAIRLKPGIRRSELWDYSGHKVKAEELDTALAGLEAQGVAYRLREGRGERWYPGGGGNGPGSGPESENGPGPGNGLEAAGEARGPRPMAQPLAEAQPGESGNCQPDAGDIPPGESGNGGKWNTQTPANDFPLSTFPPSPDEFIEELAASRPAKAGQEEEGGECVVQPLPEFRAECRQAMGPWDRQTRKGIPDHPNEASQLRWYMEWKKGEAEREKQRQELKADALSGEDYFHELEAMMWPNPL